MEKNPDKVFEYGRKYRELYKDVICIKKHKENRSTKARFRTLVNASKKKFRNLTISFVDFEQLILKSCYYCYASLQNEAGYSLDRIDNSKGYTLDNVLPCCGKCNRLRGNDLTVEETKVVIAALKKFRGAHQCVWS